MVPLTDKTVLFGATMWTNMKNRDPFVLITAKRGMNDFCGCILKATDVNAMRRYTPEDSVLEFEKTQEVLKDALKQHPDKNFLVMTHHTPSYLSIHPKYGDDLLNYAYTTDLSNLILDNPRIKHYVHGHTHDSFDYMIGDCRIMCNPRGYTNNPKVLPENRAFDINFNFEVE